MKPNKIRGPIPITTNPRNSGVCCFMAPFFAGPFNSHRTPSPLPESPTNAEATTLPREPNPIWTDGGSRLLAANISGEMDIYAPLTAKILAANNFQLSGEVSDTIAALLAANNAATHLTAQTLPPKLLQHHLRTTADTHSKILAANIFERSPSDGSLQKPRLQTHLPSCKAPFKKDARSISGISHICFLKYTPHTSMEGHALCRKSRTAELLAANNSGLSYFGRQGALSQNPIAGINNKHQEHYRRLTQKILAANNSTQSRGRRTLKSFGSRIRPLCDSPICRKKLLVANNSILITDREPVTAKILAANIFAARSVLCRLLIQRNFLEKEMNSS